MERAGDAPGVYLVVVGSLTPAIEAQAERLGVGPALHVTERIESADMATLYTTAAVLLFPSHYEGFGLPDRAAQICGTPVVCSDRGRCRRWVPPLHENLAQSSTGLPKCRHHQVRLDSSALLRLSVYQRRMGRRTCRCLRRAPS